MTKSSSRSRHQLCQHQYLHQLSGIWPIKKFNLWSVLPQLLHPLTSDAQINFGKIIIADADHKTADSCDVATSSYRKSMTQYLCLQWCRRPASGVRLQLPNPSIAAVSRSSASLCSSLLSSLDRLQLTMAQVNFQRPAGTN
jgi:hypothetical protein